MTNRDPDGRIRVLEVIATLDGAGAQRQMAYLAARLDRCRFEVSIVALTRGGPVEDLLREAGVSVRILGKRRRVSPGVLLALAAEVRRFRPHVIHTHLFTADVYGRAAGLLARGAAAFVATAHCTEPSRRAHYVVVDRMLASRSAAVVCVSEAVWAAYEARGIPTDKLVVVRNGVDANAVAQAAAGVEPESGLIATACRLSPEKDVPTLVRAVGLLRAGGVDARLVVAGEGGERTVIEAEIVRLGLDGAVRLVGYRPDVYRLMAGAGVFALASRTEGLSMAIAEAMALGRPVVATRVGGNAELVDEGRTGVLVSPGDAGALAGALAAFLRDPALARVRGAAGQARVRKCFDAARMVRGYETLFEHVAGSRAARRDPAGISSPYKDS